MITIIRKYFISGLTILLVISNFSYASSSMFCSMSEDMDPCTCMHDESSTSSKSILKSERNSCCDSRIVELNNSNILLKSDNSLTDKIFLSSIDFNIDLQYTANAHLNKLYTLTSNHNFHAPKDDIPVFISSLLI